MNPTLPALLCLGEMRRGKGALVWRDPSPQSACSLRGPQGPGGSRGGEALLRAEGRPLTGLSLPALSVGLRTQVQAGESVLRAQRPPLLGTRVTPRPRGGGR